MSLELEDVDDKYVQENFRRVKEAIEASLLFEGMNLLEVTCGKAETALRVPHGLSFKPEDVIITNSQGAGSLTVLFEQTTREHLVVTSTGACVVRLLVGTIGGA